MSSERIKTQRKLLGWTQERMASELGVSLRTYSRAEKSGPSKLMQNLVDTMIAFMQLTQDKHLDDNSQISKKMVLENT